MAETRQFTIGAEASCTDGICGGVSRVVIDPVARAVTHLVVERMAAKGSPGLFPCLPLADIDHPDG